MDPRRLGKPVEKQSTTGTGDTEQTVRRDGERVFLGFIEVGNRSLLYSDLIYRQLSGRVVSRTVLGAEKQSRPFSYMHKDGRLTISHRCLARLQEGRSVLHQEIGAPFSVPCRRLLIDSSCQALEDIIQSRDHQCYQGTQGC